MGIKRGTEVLDSYIYIWVVEERSLCRWRRTVRTVGGMRSDNAGTSNDKIGKKPIRRKPKGSWVKLIYSGLVGP